MWCHQADKFARRDDLRILPEGREVLTIAGNQKVGPSRVGTFNKDVVVRIARQPRSGERERPDGRGS